MAYYWPGFVQQPTACIQSGIGERENFQHGKMKINTNTWNKIRYTLYQPVYDLAGGLFQKYRKKSIDRLGLQQEEAVLILGAGTGLDLPFLTARQRITAIDITPSMVAKLKDRARKLSLDVDARVMDGQKLEFKDNTFDAIILHLIVAVVPAPVKCLQEAARVLKPGGRITIMDKFIPPGTRPGVLRRVLNPVANFLFSAINRDIDKILLPTSLVKKEDLFLNASYRIISATKEQEDS